MKNLIVTFLILLFVTASQAQSVTGYWYGQANVEVAGIQNNYLTELIIAQKGNKVKGFFGYYFKDVYQSFVVKGTYDRATRKVVINNIPIIFYRTNSTENSVDCITSFYGTLHVSRVKTELSGYFYRDKKYTYTCPDLRVNYTLYAEAKVQDSIFKDMTSTRSFWKPQPPPVELVKGKDAQDQSEMAAMADSEKQSKAKDVASNGTTAGNKSDAASTSLKPKETTEAATGNDPNKETKSSGNAIAASEKQNAVAVVKAEEKPVLPSDIVKINTEFKKRKPIVGKLIEVASDSVRLSFYDNAEVDGDSISVFLNGNLVVAHQGLTERAFNVYVQLDSTKDVNEVSMFAENLGKYPPNTALMVISDGEKRYETFLSSDFNGNATIKLRHRRNGIAGATQ
ncbi:MAG: hypothetical protein Q8918_06345 [Bacteroidota bacterium]|nr:hypothetical protein [Bacteroidota bacterium]MDP4211498.1 hypothetical protein [Bacteroidota bacterium]MDP4249713.1 hypothetical protein [Bacteroidota bacterium]